LNLLAAEYGPWEVTGALSVAPLPIQLLRDVLLLLLIVALSWSVVYLGYDRSLAMGMGFLLALAAAVWRCCWWRHCKATQQPTDWLRVSPAGIDRLLGATPSVTPLILCGVIRHWAGVTLLCESQKGDLLVRQRLTLWRDYFGREDYRRLSVLLNGLIRGQA